MSCSSWSGQLSHVKPLMGSSGCGGLGVSLEDRLEELAVSESSSLPRSGWLHAVVAVVPSAVPELVAWESLVLHCASSSWLVVEGWVRAFVQRTPAQGVLSSPLAAPVGCCSSLVGAAGCWASCASFSSALYGL